MAIEQFSTSYQDDRFSNVFVLPIMLFDIQGLSSYHSCMRNVSELIVNQRGMLNYAEVLSFSEDAVSPLGKIFSIMKENIINDFKAQDILLEGYCKHLNEQNTTKYILYFDAWVNFVIKRLLELKTRSDIYSDIKKAVASTSIHGEEYERRKDFS